MSRRGNKAQRWWGTQRSKTPWGTQCSNSPGELNTQRPQGNPMLNSSGNPMLNETGNPMLNSSGNPMLNETGNPTLNSSGNPMLKDIGEPKSPKNRWGNQCSKMVGNPTLQRPLREPNA